MKGSWLRLVSKLLLFSIVVGATCGIAARLLSSYLHVTISSKVIGGIAGIIIGIVAGLLMGKLVRRQ